MSSPTNVRFPPAVDAALAAYARRMARPKSTVVVEALGEWLRMQAHPGVIFVTNTTGERRAALIAGPQVWTIAAAWAQHPADGRDVPLVARTLELSERDVELALTYWAEHRDEIDDLVARHRADQDQALTAWERRRAIDAV